MSDATKSPYQQARETFNTYASMNEPKLPDDPGSALQVMHFRWAEKKVKHTLPARVEGVLGVCEEVGEFAEHLLPFVLKMVAASGRLAHLVLNESQGRRGYDQDVEKLRELVADALADAAIFGHHVATAFRLDYWTLVRATALKVMNRDWKSNPLDAHKDG